MPDEGLSNEIADFLRQGGAVLSGFADLSVLPSDIRQGLPIGIVFALAIDPAIVATLPAGPTREYAAEYERLNAALDALSGQCADFIVQRGYRTVVQGSTVAVLDHATLATPLPHKTVATRAGLGWIGKCALLVTEAYGSAIRIASILTDAPLLVGTPVERSCCGACASCCERCPGGAPSGRPWQAGLPREAFFDARACAKTARQLAGKLGIPHTICGRCIAACPWTQRYLIHPGRKECQCGS